MGGSTQLEEVHRDHAWPAGTHRSQGRPLQGHRLGHPQVQLLLGSRRRADPHREPVGTRRTRTTRATRSGPMRPCTTRHLRRVSAGRTAPRAPSLSSFELRLARLVLRLSGQRASTKTFGWATMDPWPTRDASLRRPTEQVPDGTRPSWAEQARRAEDPRLLVRCSCPITRRTAGPWPP